MNHKPTSISICALALVISASYFEMAHLHPRELVTPLRGNTREMRAGKVTWFVAVYSVDFSVQPRPVGPLPA